MLKRKLCENDSGHSIIFTLVSTFSLMGSELDRRKTMVRSPAFGAGITIACIGCTYDISYLSHGIRPHIPVPCTRCMVDFSLLSLCYINFYLYLRML